MAPAPSAPAAPLPPCFDADLNGKTPPTVYPLPYSLYSTPPTVHSLLYTHTVHPVQCPSCSTLPTEHPLQCTPYSTLCAARCAMFAVDSWMGHNSKITHAYGNAWVAFLSCSQLVYCSCTALVLPVYLSPAHRLPALSDWIGDTGVPVE